MSAEADGAEVQNPEVHNAVTAEDTDDAGNAGAKEKDSAVTDDAATVEESKTITDSTAGVNGSVAGENAAGMDETDVTEENADGMAEAVKKLQQKKTVRQLQRKTAAWFWYTSTASR